MTARGGGPGPIGLRAVLDRLGGAVLDVRRTAPGRSDEPGPRDEPVIRSVEIDSRNVGDGTLFAAVRGEHHDGHAFVRAAVQSGAVAVLVEEPVEALIGLDGTSLVDQIVVDDVRRRIGPVASLVEGDPSRRLVTIGITGTNGKTTTSHLLASILETAGTPTGVLGTLAGPRTTPEAPELQRAIAGFDARGCAAVVLEVSSHALALHRVDGTEFDVVAFTNLGHDHLDLHGTLEAYYRAKARLFTADFAPVGVVNVADEHGRRLAETIDRARRHDTRHAMRAVPFDHRTLEDVWVTADRHGYTWRGVRIDVSIGGGFNVANSIAAATVAAELGIPVGDIAEGLRRAAPVPGRFERIEPQPGVGAGSPVVIVDYAHTPEGLAEVLGAARPHVGPSGRLIVVVGCGGDRDRQKRPEMGAVASDLADRIVVTSDNPRHEDPSSIIEGIVEGIPAPRRGDVATDVDRRRAIDLAITSAAAGDVVVIAGKGHESTQQIGDDLVPFDDRAEARRAIERRAVERGAHGAVR